MIDTITKPQLEILHLLAIHARTKQQLVTCTNWTGCKVVANLRSLRIRNFVAIACDHYYLTTTGYNAMHSP